MNNILFFLFLSPLAMAQSYFTPREVYDFAIGDTLEFSILAETAFTPFQDYSITRFSIASKTYNADSSEICYFAISCERCTIPLLSLTDNAQFLHWKSDCLS